MSGGTATELPRSFLELLALLLHSPSVTGAEHPYFRVLQRELEERGAVVTWYEGVLVAHGDAPESLMLSAHADRHGLVCTGPGEFQYAAFVAGARSDLLGNSVSEQLMTKVAGRFTDTPVYAYDPWSGAYQGQGRIVQADVCDRRGNLIFDVDGLDHVVAGTPVALADRLVVDGGRLSGQLDNVLGTAALVHLFERGFRGTAFFTAGEEAGKSWRFLLEWFRRFGSSTNQLVVVDTSPFPDFEAAVGQRLVLRHRDANASFDADTTAMLADLCRARGHDVLFKDEWVEARNVERQVRGEGPQSLGSTELGRIVAASDGLVTGTTLQVPTSGYHTLEETAPEASVTAFLDVLTAAAEAKLRV